MVTVRSDLSFLQEDTERKKLKVNSNTHEQTDKQNEEARFDSSSFAPASVHTSDS